MQSKFTNVQKIVEESNPIQGDYLDDKKIVPRNHLLTLQVNSLGRAALAGDPALGDCG